MKTAVPMDHAIVSWRATGHALQNRLLPFALHRLRSRRTGDFLIRHTWLRRKVAPR